jgi:hypothetical protein
MVIQPQFDEADGFREGLSWVWVRIDKKWGAIDKTGKMVIQPQFAATDFFSEGLAAIEIGEKWGFIDRTGRVVIPAQFEHAGDIPEGIPWVFSEGLARFKVRQNNHGPVSKFKWGYIDKNGKVVIQPTFAYCRDFHEGLAAVGFEAPKR